MTFQESSAPSWTLCDIILSERVVTCTPVKRRFGRPLAKYEITDKTVVREHEEFHHNSLAPRRSEGEEAADGIYFGDPRLRYSFYVNKLDDNNKLTFLEFSCDTSEVRALWKEQMISTKKEYIREQEIKVYGTDTHRLTSWKLDKQFLPRSPNILNLLKLEEISMKSSALLSRTFSQEQFLSTVPDGSTHFRWFHANAGNIISHHSLMAFLTIFVFEALQDKARRAKINLDDPDVIFLLDGGLSFYDKKGDFIGALSISSHDSEYYINFGEPVKLSSEDVER